MAHTTTYVYTYTCTYVFQDVMYIYIYIDRYTYILTFTDRYMYIHLHKSNRMNTVQDILVPSMVRAIPAAVHAAEMAQAFYSYLAY